MNLVTGSITLLGLVALFGHVSKDVIREEWHQMKRRKRNEQVKPLTMWREISHN